MRTLFFVLSFVFLIIKKDLPAQNECMLIFHPLFNGEALSKDRFYVTGNGDTVKIVTFKMYLTGFEITGQNPDFHYKEMESYHLLDWGDSTSLTFALRNIPEGWRSGLLHFNAGTDSLTNVSGAMGGALDPTKGMYWAWQSGYINMKLEGNSSSCKTRNHEFQFHLGGYLSPYSTMRHINLNISEKKTIHIGLELSDFFRTIDLKKQNHIMSPCKEAVFLSEEEAKMFYLLNP